MWCAWCGDEYAPVEYRLAPVDPDEPSWCGSRCEDAWNESVEADQAYDEARYSAAPVY